MELSGIQMGLPLKLDGIEKSTGELKAKQE